MQKSLMQRYRTWRAVRQTMDELNNLSDRELRDLGISRHNLAKIARDSVR